MFGVSNWRGYSAARLFGSRTIADRLKARGRQAMRQLKGRQPGARVANRTGNSARLNLLSWTFPSSA
jgi:hypothetical protein